MENRSLCYHHGGKNLQGLAAPGFKHGLRSKVLPTRMLARYHAALEDGELLSLRDDLAVMDARLSDVLSRVDTGESGKVWAMLKSALVDFIKAEAKEDYLAKGDAIGKLHELINEGAADYAAWGEVKSIIEQRRKLVESEQKRLIALQQTITAEQAMTFVAALSESVKKHVNDRDALEAITNDLVRILGRSVALEGHARSV